MVDGLRLAYAPTMVTIKVQVQRPGGPNDAIVEARSFRESPNHLHLDDRCGLAIADVVAVDGSLGQNFVLEVNGVAYRGCRIVGRGRECKIMFLTKDAA